MKKLLLAICLLMSSSTYTYFYEPVHYTDPKEMIMHLQRVINTSNNPADIAHAEYLIREVYGPQCEKRSWRRFKYTAAGIVSFITLLNLSGKYGVAFAGSGALLTYMAVQENNWFNS